MKIVLNTKLYNKLFAFIRCKQANATFEFAIVLSLFIFVVLSVLELLLLRSYVTFAESAVVRGLEAGFAKTKLTQGQYIITDKKLDPNQLIKPNDIKNNIPKVLDFFTDGNPQITISEVHDYNSSKLALNSHKAYECLIEANWRPFSPYILTATSGNVMPLKIKARFNDY